MRNRGTRTTTICSRFGARIGKHWKFSGGGENLELALPIVDRNIASWFDSGSSGMCYRHSIAIALDGKRAWFFSSFFFAKWWGPAIFVRARDLLISQGSPCHLFLLTLLQRGPGIKVTGKGGRMRVGCSRMERLLQWLHFLPGLFTAISNNVKRYHNIKHNREVAGFVS